MKRRILVESKIIIKLPKRKPKPEELDQLRKIFPGINLIIVLESWERETTIQDGKDTPKQ